MADSKKQKWTNPELLEVAKRQSQIVWMIVIGLLALYIANQLRKYFAEPLQTYAIYQLGAFVTGLIQLYFIYKLALAIRSRTAWLYIILSFIPIVTLFTLLFISWKAIVILKKNGIQMGLLGAKSSSLDKLKTKN